MSQFIKDLVTCKYKNCSKFFETPIRLDCCDMTICRIHIDELFASNKSDSIKFKCEFCNQISDFNKDQKFKYNREVISILKNPDIYLSPQQLTLRKAVADLNEKLNALNVVANDPDNFIYEEISVVRNEIDLEREKMIKIIQDSSDVMLNQLKNYELQCKNNIKNYSDYINNLKTSKEALKVNIDKSMEILRQPNPNDGNFLNSLISLLQNESFKHKKALVDLKNLLLNSKKPWFDKNKKFTSETFGSFKIIPFMLDSNDVKPALSTSFSFGNTEQSSPFSVNVSSTPPNSNLSRIVLKPASLKQTPSTIQQPTQLMPAQSQPTSIQSNTFIFGTKA